MSELLELLKMPIPSLAGLLVLWALAERAGLPVTKMVSSLLKLNGKKDDNGAPEWAQHLKEHYNDTTSTLLERIAKGVEKLDSRSETQCKKLDIIIRNQEEEKENSVEWRRESRETMRDLLRKV